MNKQLITGLLFVVLVPSAYFLGSHHAARVPGAPAPGRHVLYYVDPMHPAYKADKPGIAPDCGMDLVPVYADGDNGGNAPPAGMVVIDEDHQKLIGLKTAAVEGSTVRESRRIVGRVAIDESRIVSITSGVEGWIRETRNVNVGDTVSKDQTLAEFYSPEFTALEQGYLVATERMNSTVKQLAAPGTQSTSARLRNFGMGERQIAEIASSHSLPENVDIAAPAAGVLMMRNAAPGQRFDKGVELYRIADYSQMWVNASLSEEDAQRLHPGTHVQVEVPGSALRLDGRVSAAVPQVDPDTRTMTVRLEVNNRNRVLKPGMFVDLLMPFAIPSALSVPADAVMDAGTEQRVYIAGPNGTFEPRRVTAGVRVGDRVQILKGLTAGERVVTDANFLVDSESRLRSTNEPPPAPLQQHRHDTASSRAG